MATLSQVRPELWSQIKEAVAQEERKPDSSITERRTGNVILRKKAGRRTRDDN